jgi:hypothetical protein
MPISKPIFRKLVNPCSIYETIQLLFINRQGGNEFWYFNKDSKRTVNIERNEFNKVLSPTYTVGDRGRTVYSSVAKDIWRINTDWISEYDYEFLEQLILSPEVYWVKLGQLLPIIIVNKDYPIKTMLREGLFNMTLDFEEAYDKNVISQ